MTFYLHHHIFIPMPAKISLLDKLHHCLHLEQPFPVSYILI